jgi:acetyl esterase/lipase
MSTPDTADMPIPDGDGDIPTSQDEALSTICLDPDYEKAVAPYSTILPPVPDNARVLRKLNDTIISGLVQLSECREEANVLETTLHYNSMYDNTCLEVRRFVPLNITTTTTTEEPPKPAVLYVHGGGFVSGSVDLFRNDIIRYASNSRTTFFAPTYRLAPEHPYPVPFQDVYSALVWLQANAEHLRIDPERIAIMGVSAGGALATAVAMAAKEDELDPRLKRLILLYPMLDDRTRLPPRDLYRHFLTWTEKKNDIGWGAYLWGGSGDHHDPNVRGSRDGDVPEYDQFAVPSRADDLRGLPSTYIDVGGLDLFRGECMEFADRLARAHVEVEFHLYPGVPHAWEWVSLKAPVTLRAMQNRLRALARL